MVAPERLNPENAAPEEQLTALRRELAEAREQQAATSEILCIMSSSPTDLQRVLDAVAMAAARLCAADGATLNRVQGRTLVREAVCGMFASGTGEARSISRDSIGGRAIVERHAIHVPGVQAVPETELRQAGSTEPEIG